MVDIHLSNLTSDMNRTRSLAVIRRDTNGHAFGLFVGELRIAMEPLLLDRQARVQSIADHDAGSIANRTAEPAGIAQHDDLGRRAIGMGEGLRELEDAA